jgi:transposase
VIDFHQFQQIHHLRTHEHLSLRQIAERLGLDPETVGRWVKRARFEAPQKPRRTSKLDPYRADIARWLEQHPYTARQIWQRLRQQGFAGQYSIVGELVRKLRPHAPKAFLSLQFLPGQCAQLDWGHAGWLQIGSTRRRVSFLVLVFCYSRKMYVEFTLGQSMEQFLCAQQNGFLFLGGVTAEMMVDNCKTAVLDHPVGGPATLHPRYVDFAQHYGFTIKACTPRQPQQKGRVESAVAYIKGNFLNGLELHSLESLNAQAKHWLNTVANVRQHAHTRRTPEELFREEIPKLRPLQLRPYEACNYLPVRANNRARVIFETNRYSVPPAYANRALVLKLYPDRLVFFNDQDQQVALHPRCYDRHQDCEQPEHLEALLAQRRQGRRQQQWVRFMNLSPLAEAYYQALEQRRENPRQHLLKILALSEHHGVEATARALQDAYDLQAFGSEYLANLLAQRARPEVTPGALHLTRASDQLELELPPPDLSLYERLGGAQ